MPPDEYSIDDVKKLLASFRPPIDAAAKRLGSDAPPVDANQAAGHDEAMADPITRTELDSKFEAMRADMRAGFAELRGEFSGIQKTFAEDRTANVKYMVVLAAAVVAILGSWQTLVLRPTPAATAAPIVIYAQPPAPAASVR